MSDEAKRQQEEDLKLLRQHVDQLAEQFDSVQIFVTRHEQGQLDGTISSTVGSGNWYARFGNVREWLIQEDQRAREQVINRGIQ